MIEQEESIASKVSNGSIEFSLQDLPSGQTMDVEMMLKIVVEALLYTLKTQRMEFSRSSTSHGHRSCHSLRLSLSLSDMSDKHQVIFISASVSVFSKY